MQRVLPVLKVEGNCLAEVWEKSLLLLWKKGCEIKTQYDNPKDKPSKDASMIMICWNPFSEPRIHLAFPGGFEDLEKYKQEVVYGVHDSWINPEEGKWTYTYHSRLFNYIPHEGGKAINQIELIVKQLVEAPYSRRAQGITWQVTQDPLSKDPPCLQRVWCRVFEAKRKGKLEKYLVMITHWRSRDAYRAAFMNMFGLTELQKYIADELSKKIGEVKVGQYIDISDSYHIYGSNFEDFEQRFLSLLKKRDFYNADRLKSRTIFSTDKAVIAGFEYGKQLLELERKTGKKGAT